MTPVEILNHLINKLSDEGQNISNRVGRGSCEDFAQYKLMVGHLKGLENAVAIIKEMKADMNKDIDFD